MTALTPFSFSPGSWTTLDILNHLWQSTAAGLAVLALLLVCASLSAHTRRALGLMAMAKFALPMAVFTGLATRFFGKSERWFESPALTLPVNFSPQPFVPVAPISSAQVPPPAHLPVGLMLGVAWAVGFAATFGWWLVRGWRLRRRILASAGPVSARMEQWIASAAGRVGLRRIPRCATVADTHDAGVLGVFSPVVILPRGLEDTLTPAELEAVLIHEFVHVKRRDNLWSALQYLLVSLFWFHPIVWLLNRRVGLEAEKACDERVLEITGDADVYAGGLVKCVRHALGVSQPSLASVTTPPVVARMQNILAHGTRRDRPIVRGAAIVTGLALLGFSGCAGTFANEKLAVVAPAKPVVPPNGVKIVSNPKFVAPNNAPAPIIPGDSRPIPKYQYNQTTGGFEVAGFDYRKTVTVDFVDEEIRTIVRDVADFLELNIIMPETLGGKKTVKTSNQLWQELFKTVLGPTGFTFVEDGNIVKIVRADSPEAAAGAKSMPGRLFSATGGEKTRAKEDTLSIDFPDEDIRNIIRNVADLFKLNVIFPEALQGKTTIKLRDVTWRQIFQVLLEPAGYTFVEDRNIVKIVSKESLGKEPVRTEIFQLNKAKASDVIPAISSLVDRAIGRIVLVGSNNTLAITERISRLSRIKSIIEELDGPTGPFDAALAEQAARAKADAEEARRKLDATQAPQIAGPKTTSTEAPREAAQVDLARQAVVQVPIVDTNGNVRGLASFSRDSATASNAAIEARQRADLSAVLSPAEFAAAAKDDSALFAAMDAERRTLNIPHVYSSGELDEPPAVITKVDPVFEPAENNQSVSGEFLFEFVVSTDGRARDIKTMVRFQGGSLAAPASDRNLAPKFVRVAEAALRQWTFRPARKAGRDVDGQFFQKIPFTLPGKQSALTKTELQMPSTLPQLTPADLAQTVRNRPATSFNGVQVFDVSKLDQTPVPKYQARPQYPFEMRRAGTSGEVVVDFIIDTNGDVQNAYASKSSQREFEAAAVQAVSKWKFKPGRKSGKDVITHMVVPIVFTTKSE